MAHTHTHTHTHTHIRIKPAVKQPDAYLNRKKFHSFTPSTPRLEISPRIVMIVANQFKPSTSLGITQRLTVLLPQLGVGNLLLKKAKSCYLFVL